MDDKSLRKAQFRETARNILHKDRFDRKYGLSVDTAGAIARALEQAYQQGLTDCREVTPPADRPRRLQWIEIPARPRDALSSLLLGVDSDDRQNRDVLDYGKQAYRFFQVRQIEEFPDHLVRLYVICWTCPATGKLWNHDLGSYKERTILPLLRLHLLEEFSLPNGQLVLFPT